MLFNTDPNRSAKEILDDIGEQAPAVYDKGAGALGLLLAPFAALIVKLSQDAEKSTQRVITRTRWLIGLTIALLIFTIPLFIESLTQLWHFFHANSPH